MGTTTRNDQHIGSNHYIRTIRSKIVSRGAGRHRRQQRCSGPDKKKRHPQPSETNRKLDHKPQRAFCCKQAVSCKASPSYLTLSCRLHMVCSYSHNKFPPGVLGTPTINSPNLSKRPGNLPRPPGDLTPVTFDSYRRSPQGTFFCSPQIIFREFLYWPTPSYSLQLILSHRNVLTV